MKRKFYYSYFLIFSFGILWSSCSEETDQKQLHLNEGKKIEVKVSIPQLSLLSFDKHSRFIQTLPESGNGQLSYSFSMEDRLSLTAKFKKGRPDSSTSLNPPTLDTVGALEYNGNDIFSGITVPDIYPEEFWGDSIYIYSTTDDWIEYYTLETGLIKLTESNSSYYVGSELKNLVNNDTKNSYLYGVDENTANPYWDTFNHQL